MRSVTVFSRIVPAYVAVAALVMSSACSKQDQSPASSQVVAGQQVARQDNEKPPAFAADTTYKAMRADLIERGFTPVTQKHEEPNEMCGTQDGEPDLCVLYPEVVDCAGSGVRPCNFLFERKADRKRLTVTTHGELASKLTVDAVAWGDASADL